MFLFKYSGITINNKDMVLRFGQIMQSMKEITTMGKNMGKANYFSQTDLNMKVNLNNLKYRRLF
jgi:hypothetical protein